MSQAAARYFHASNLLSYLSLLSGFLAIVFTYEHSNLSVAGGLIAFCSLADLLDGKFAALFVRREDQKAFGIQLDSLTDATVFGLAPVICLGLSLPTANLSSRLIWFGAGFFYLLCAITRLGAYNIQSDGGGGFIGLPTTIAGLLCSSIFLAGPSALVSILLLLGCGIAMISPIPIARPGRLGIVAIACWATLLMIAHGSRI